MSSLHGGAPVVPSAPPPSAGRGVARAAAGLLSAGVYGLLAGGLVLLPFALSPYAIQNDVYMGNLFLGLPLLAVGAILAFGGLVAVGRSPGGTRWRLAGGELLLAAAGAGVLALAYVLFGGRYVSVGPPVDWPVYLTMPLLALAVVIGLVVVVVGVAWGRRTGRGLGMVAAS
jgi:hypothetical protein